jgi:hypothetical protein
MNLSFSVMCVWWLDTGGADLGEYDSSRVDSTAGRLVMIGGGALGKGTSTAVLTRTPLSSASKAIGGEAGMAASAVKRGEKAFSRAFAASFS